MEKSLFSALLDIRDNGAQSPFRHGVVGMLTSWATNASKFSHPSVANAGPAKLADVMNSIMFRICRFAGHVWLQATLASEESDQVRVIEFLPNLRGALETAHDQAHAAPTDGKDTVDGLLRFIVLPTVLDELFKPSTNEQLKRETEPNRPPAPPTNASTEDTLGAVPAIVWNREWFAMDPTYREDRKSPHVYSSRDWNNLDIASLDDDFGHTHYSYTPDHYGPTVANCATWAHAALSSAFSPNWVEENSQFNRLPTVQIEKLDTLFKDRGRMNELRPYFDGSVFDKRKNGAGLD